MLKGTRQAILKKLQPVSIHGQMAWDVYFVRADDPDGQTSVARVGTEAVAMNIEAGDPIELEYLVGQVVRVSRLGAK
jgi:hypothetical protein